MEKTSHRLSSSSSILSFLPNRASFSGHLQHHPYSPGRDVIKQLQRRGFSGPMVSIVPMEARRRKQKSGGGFETPEEPTSPKVTCMGKIKLRKMAARCSGKQKPPADDRRRATERSAAPLLIRRIFRRRKARAAATADGGGGSSNVSHVLDPAKSRSPAAAPARAPLLGQMRRFASGREGLGEFDWRKAASGDGGEEDSDDEEEEEVLVPHSAPLMVGNGVATAAAALEPRKEVNLWKRRTLAPPIPLQLNN